jgi:arylsulfatase A-like enzyme
MEGRSLVPLIRGENMQERPAFSMTFRENSSMGHPITRGTVAVWYDGYKLIHYFDENNSRSLLFNLKDDPSELDNLIDEDPETGQFLLHLIDANLEKANKRITGGSKALLN